jgi:hypothetical protein
VAAVLAMLSFVIFFCFCDTLGDQPGKLDVHRARTSDQTLRRTACVVNDVSLEIAEGELFVLLHPVAAARARSSG